MARIGGIKRIRKMPMHKKRKKNKKNGIKFANIE